MSRIIFDRIKLHIYFNRFFFFLFMYSMHNFFLWLCSENLLRKISPVLHLKKNNIKTKFISNYVPIFLLPNETKNKIDKIKVDKIKI